MRWLNLIFAVVMSLLAFAGCGAGAKIDSNSESQGSPLFVYTKRAEGAQNANNDGYAHVTVVYDVNANKTIASFQPAAEGRRAQALIAGKILLLNLGDNIVRRDYDGTNEQVLWEAPDGSNVIGMALSPDKSLLAFTVVPNYYPQEQDPRLVVFVDIASGKERLVVQQTAESFPNYSGHVALPAWRDDGKGVVVYGWRHAGAPGGVATVLLDGTVRVHTLTGFPWIAPNGRYVWHGPEGSYMAECFPAKTNMVLRDLDSDIDLTHLSDGDRVLAPKDWSPDGKEMLYASYALRRDDSYTDCEDCFEVDLDSAEWHLLHLGGFQTDPVADPTAILRQRRDDRYVEVRCDGRPLLDGICQTADAREKAVDIYVGDTFVDSGLEVVPVGFIEP